MTVLVRLVALLLLVLAGTAAAHAQQIWSSSPMGPDAVIGCSDSTTDDDWTCLAVACEPDGRLGLYLELTGLTFDDDFTLVVGDRRFAVRGAPRGESAPYSNRISGDVPAIAAAMKAGREVRIERPRHPLNPGFDTIPLRGSSRAIAGIEARCGLPARQSRSPSAPADKPLVCYCCIDGQRICE